MSIATGCPNCHAPLAADQRYCLNCGHSLTGPRVDFRRELALDAPAAGPEGIPIAGGPPPERRGALMTLTAVAAVLLALGVGIVIGRGNGNNGAAKPQVITVAGTSGAAAASAGTASAAGQITDDWGSGSGYTIELSSLDKGTATAASVTAAKSAAQGKGAPAVGALDGDGHSGTPTGKYVVYSGHFSSAKAAKAALGKLSGKFPGALVLHVQPAGAGSAASSGGGSSSNGSASGGNAQTNANTGAAASIQGVHGAALSKASAKLPSTVGTGGAPPPKDNAKPGGGGGGGTCIGC